MLFIHINCRQSTNIGASCKLHFYLQGARRFSSPRACHELLIGAFFVCSCDRRFHHVSFIVVVVSYSMRKHCVPNSCQLRPELTTINIWHSLYPQSLIRLFRSLSFSMPDSCTQTHTSIAHFVWKQRNNMRMRRDK